MKPAGKKARLTSELPHIVTGVVINGRQIQGARFFESERFYLELIGERGLTIEQVVANRSKAQPP